jgi:hypothetical protein
MQLVVSDTTGMEVVMPKSPKVTSSHQNPPVQEIAVDVPSSPADDIQLAPPWYAGYMMGMKDNYHTSNLTAPLLGMWYAHEGKRHLGLELEGGYEAAMDDIASILDSSPLGYHPRGFIQALEAICDQSSAEWKSQFEEEDLASLTTEDPDPIAERLDTWDRGYRAALCIFAEMIGSKCVYA